MQIETTYAAKIYFSRHRPHGDRAGQPNLPGLVDVEQPDTGPDA